MSTMNELKELIGKQASYASGGLDIPVTICDARNIFGRVDVQIQVGDSKKWVKLENVRVEDPRKTA